MNFRKSVFFRLSLGFLVFYSAYTTCFFFYDAFSEIPKYKRQKNAQLISFVRAGRVFLNSGLREEAELRMKEGIRDRSIDMYALIENKKVVNSQGAEEISPDFLIAFPVDQMSLYQDFSIGKIKVGEQELIVGTNFGVKTRIKNLWNDNKKTFFQDILFVLVSVFVMTLYFFRNLIRILRAIAARDRSLMNEITGDSYEAEFLARTLGTYEFELKEQKAKNAKLTEQMLPALRKEMDSGQLPPYEFDCIMARVDINNFSTIFNQYPREVFMKLIGDFFLECTHIIGKYDGLVHEFAGDEVIFYFKEKPETSAAHLAVGAIREIFELAEQTNMIAKRDHGYDFIVKAAFGKGSLRFGQLVANLTLAGAPFIETVRILSQVSEKEKNTLFLPGSIATQVGNICQVRSEGLFSLKGYQGEVELFSYSKHRWFNEVWNDFVKGKSTDIRYYRSIGDLEFALKAVREMENLETFLLSVSILRGVVLTKAVPELIQAVSDLLAAEIQKKDVYKVSSLLPLMVNFIPKESFTKKLEDLCLSALAIKDRRVVANVIELFQFFYPERAIPELKPYVKDFDNRISANALVKAAMEQFDDRIVNLIHDKLKSKSVAHIASGLYAIGEIAAYYRKQDAIYLSTKVRFLDLFKQIIGWAKHENVMVQRQAMVAVQKINDERLSAELNRLYESGKLSSQGSALYEQIFSRRKKQAA